MAGKGVAVQVNTAENPQLAARFGIRGIPTVVILDDGLETGRVSGFMTRDALLAWWKEHIQ